MKRRQPCSVKPLTPAAFKLAVDACTWIETLDITKPVYLTTDVQMVAQHVGRSREDFDDAYGYSHPLEDGSYLVWVNPKAPPKERDTTLFHELLHVRFPKMREAEVERLSNPHL